jgi:DNA-binding ferritin-like protein
MSAVTKPDWPMKRCRPEEYAPSNRRPAIHSENRSSNELAERMAALVGQAAGATLDQIDQVAGELEKMRHVLRSEAEHVGRLIDNYVGLSNAAITAMKIISEKLKPFQRPE